MVTMLCGWEDTAYSSLQPGLLTTSPVNWLPRCWEQLQTRRWCRI